MLRDDRVISILTGLIIVIAMAMLAQRSDDLIAFLLREEAPGIAPRDDAAEISGERGVLIDVLANDENAAPDDGGAIRIVSSPDCGAAEATPEGVLYVANESCVGPQRFVYCVRRADECPAAAVTVTVAPAD